jgi:hypothetical protein
VTARSGITFRHRFGGFGKKYFVESSGSGLCFFDYDNDGDPDLYVVQAGTLPTRPGYGGAENRSALYRNDGGGHFTDVTDQAGVPNLRYGQGACAGDYNNDGLLDLFVTSYGANRLYQNNGNGTFTDVTREAGVDSTGYNTSAAFCDYDHDGFLDLYVARYARYKIGSDPYCSLVPHSHSYCPPQEFDGETDLLFHNDGHGHFRDVTQEAGVSDPGGRGLGVVWTDYDNDGWPDLYVANDGSVNRLYRNLGNGHFQDVTMQCGVGMSETGKRAGSMGVDSGDYDGDGWFDLFIANFTNEPDQLYRNRAGGFFDPNSYAAGLSEATHSYSGFGAAFIDYDLDGWPDLLIQNGHVQDDIDRGPSGYTYAEPKQLFRNLGTGRFADVSAQVGSEFTRKVVGRGLALADWDGDGDVDFAATTCGGPVELFRNDGGNAHRWLQVRLRAKTGDPFGIGARVTLRAGGREQIREIRSGTSFCSQHDLAAFFGVGTAEQIESVTVRWPGRASERWLSPSTNRRLTLEEGTGTRLK